MFSLCSVGGVRMRRTRKVETPVGFGIALLALLVTTAAIAEENAIHQIDEALQNITTLVRPGKVGYATFWDGNKFIQCRRLPDRQIRCEAAGSTMQPSLKPVLTGERLSRLGTLGWTLDPSFGNFTRAFPADAPTDRVAAEILRTLVDAYGARDTDLELQTTWVVDVPCPPRAGPSQNLAGSVNDSPAMRRVTIRTCSFVPRVSEPAALTDQSLDGLRELYGSRITAEIQRLRLNRTRHVYVIFDAGIGYIQCMPQTPVPAIYCEAQSAESWAALAAVLTPERIALLHDAGYAEPGRAPNYAKTYPIGPDSDRAIADEILTILHSVYGYSGKIALKMKTE